MTQLFVDLLQSICCKVLYLIIFSFSLVSDCRLCKITMHNRTCISCDIINCSVSCICADSDGNVTRLVIKLEKNTGRRCSISNNDSNFRCYDFLYVKVICSDSSIHSEYAESIKSSDMMKHLHELNRIAIAENGTRAVNTKGFSRTLDYITDHLSANTNYKVTKSVFPLTFRLARTATFSSLKNGIAKEHIYSIKGEFYHVEYSLFARFASYLPLTNIPNVGCLDSDWLVANMSSFRRVALVKRGICTFEEKALFAVKYKAVGLLIYNDGASPDRIEPISITLSDSISIPVLFLSYTLGQSMVNVTNDPLTNILVYISTSSVSEVATSAANICADTPTGDATQTIVIGSHSDSVNNGPGINDNG